MWLAILFHRALIRIAILFLTVGSGPSARCDREPRPRSLSERSDPPIHPGGPRLVSFAENVCVNPGLVVNGTMAGERIHRAWCS